MPLLVVAVSGQEPGDVEVARARLPAAHQAAHRVALLLLLELGARLRVHCFAVSLAQVGFGGRIGRQCGMNQSRDRGRGSG